MPKTARGYYGSQGSLANLNPRQNETINPDAAIMSGTLFQLPFTAGLQAIQLRPQERRGYLFIQNQSVLNQLIVGFGRAPNAGTPNDGLLLPIFPSFIEFDKYVPDNTIYVIGTGAGTTGIVLFGLI